MNMRRIVFRVRDESGQALVLAMAIVIIGMLLGLGALTYALASNGQSVHDERARGAQQAADAGTQQQLYLNSSSNSVGFSGGTLGLSTLLDCGLPSLSLSLGVARVGVGSAGGACQSYTSTGAQCDPTTTTCPPWSPLGNQDFYQSEFFPNAQEQSSTTSTTGSDVVEFPEIVSVGCHTTKTASPKTSCADGDSGNYYSRQLSVLDPTGPLQAVEAGNNITINSPVVGALNNAINSGLTCQQTTSVLGGSSSTCSLTSAVSGVLSSLGLGGVGDLLNSVLGNLLQTLTCSTPLLGNLLCSTSTVTATAAGAASDLLSPLGGLMPAVVDGNLSAGNNIYLPGITVDLNTNTDAGLSGSASGTLGGLNLGALGGVLSGVLGVVANPSSLFPTFEFHNKVCGNASTSGSCGTTAAGAGVTAIAPTMLQTSQVCGAGKPSNSCTLQRPTFQISGSVTPETTSGTGWNANNPGPVGSTLTGTGASASYSATTGDLTVNKGTLTLSPGTYVFCSVYVGSGATISDSGGTGAVQIFIESPSSTNSGQCSTQSSAGALPAGDFVACAGLNNVLTGGGLNSVSGVINPSAMQIYLQGTSQTNGGKTLAAGSGTAIGSNDQAISGCPSVNATSGIGGGPTYYGTAPSTGAYKDDPQTIAYIGDPTSGPTATPATDAFVLYAPGSEVSISTTLAFEGSIVGWNDNVTALAILQDLDLGNYPLASVINAYQVNQTVQCNNDVENLAGYETGTSKATAISTGTSNSGNAGDLNGC